VRSGMRTAVAQTSRRWTICEGRPQSRRRLGRHHRRHRQCNYTLGRGSVHFVGAGSVLASKTKDDPVGLQGPLPPVIHGVLSPERQCMWQMILRWPSGHGAGRCGHFVNGHLFEVASCQFGRSWVEWLWLRTRRFCFLFERPDAV
jgi:hypothetical protein